MNDTSVVQVLECQDASNAAATAPGVADLRQAVAANTRIAPTLRAAGANPEQVVALRRGADGAFAFYVIGAFR